MTPFVVIDLGGCLFRFDHAHRLERLAAILALPPAELDELLWHPDFSDDCDRGRYESATDMRGAIRELTGYTGADDDLDAAWCSAFTPDAAVVDQLRRHRGTRALAVFTNNGPIVADALPRLHPRAFDGVDRMLFSYQLRQVKPDPAAFAAATSQLDTDPSRVVFIDDSPANVAAARAFGWTSHRFEDAHTVARALSAGPSDEGG